MKINSANRYREFFDYFIRTFFLIFMVFPVCAAPASGSELMQNQFSVNQCGERMFEDIQVKSASLLPSKNPDELLLALRQIHEGFFLLDSNLVSDERLRNLFGDGLIEALDFKSESIAAKEMRAGERNELHVKLIISHSRSPDTSPPKRRGRINVVPQIGQIFYRAESIEKNLTFDVQGKDVLKEQALNLSDLHARESYSRRGKATHPKGYFFYRDVKETKCLRSILMVRLSGDGVLWDININQEEK